MATIIRHEVTQYAISMFSGTDLRFNQRIMLYGPENATSTAFFYEEGVPMPAPSASHAPNDIRITLSYRSNRFDSVVDVLRNERPIVVFYDEGGRYAAISTTLEGVGEGE